ncbi:sodium:proton antiporter [Thermococcus sp.]|uniref:cation:proton antiporter n=1 Tax=Thermococcus sp. TaxID=35749 RepID=UPI002624B71C|nr:sodium:proton antiporter [Thermococcus sp.]
MIGASGLPSVEMMVFVFFIVMAIGFISLLISQRTNVSYIPLFIFFGMFIGPVLNFVNRDLAHVLFDYVRVFGLVMILFTEGHNLSLFLLKKRLGTVLTLDTVGLLITALIAAAVFSWLFHVPFVVGFLFGAIISATDPATLIPLFRQHRVRQDIETIIVTESIFNDPLGIVLTSVAVALLVPQAPSARILEMMAGHIGIYPAAVVFFLYQMLASIVIGIGMGFLGYWILKRTGVMEFPDVIIYSLSLAFGGFLLGEMVHASGYLVATVTGIVLGNHKILFKEDIKTARWIVKAIEREVHFNESLAAIATIFIFTLLGASIDLSVIYDYLWKGILISFAIIFVARPLAALPILKWHNVKEYLFISLEGPRGVVPSALASFPLTLGLTYHDPQLIHWGEIILGVTIIAVLTTVIVETLWVPFLREKLLTVRSIVKEFEEKGYKPSS